MIKRFVLIVGVVLTMGIYSGAFDLTSGEELKTLDIVVNLKNVSDNIGTYEVVVTAYGDDIISKSRIINTSTQSRNIFISE
jgi:hypothetical protein